MCGIIGVANTKDASALLVIALQALQHRGQDATGILAQRAGGHGSFKLHRSLGLVADNFTDESLLRELDGTSAIGHTRYRTSGSREIVPQDIQPFFTETLPLGVVHNGTLTNANKIKGELIKQGALFQSETDTEIILHLVARSERRTLEERIEDALTKLEGAYSLIFLTSDKLIAARDPHGFRPLILGKKGDSYVVTSETCALDVIDASFIREINSGEMLTINRDNELSARYFFSAPQEQHFCIFEYVYFARPDSVLQNLSVYGVREKLGRKLAEEHPVDADIVVPVPDSGVTAALGFSKESGLPFELGLIRNHYVGRTFIEPTDEIRRLGILLKHNANPIVCGKRIALIDDSIVRGNSARKIAELLRAAGAVEIHMRISSPPITGQCYFGIDTPTKDELIASGKSVKEIAKIIGVDSLAFLSSEGMHEAVGLPGMCDACFSGNYPIAVTND